MKRAQSGWTSGARTHAWILIASLTLGATATAGAVWWYYKRQLAAMEEAVIQELKAVSENKTRQVASWREERLGDGRVLQSSHYARIATRLLAGHAIGTDHADLTELLQQFQEAFHYGGAILAHADGTPVFSTRGAELDSARLRELTGIALHSRKVQLSDLRLVGSAERPLMALLVPLEDRGAMLLDIDPTRFLYPYLRTWAGHSRTAETVLLRRESEVDALYLSELRHRPDSPLHLHRSLIGMNLPTSTEFDAGWLFRGRDYRSVPAIGIVRAIPNSPWYLSAKIDAAEASAPERRLGWEMAILTALIALVNVVGVALVWRSQSDRIHREREQWFHAIANDTPAYLWMASAERGNSFINAPLARFLGTTETSLEKAWGKSIHPEDEGRVREVFLKALEDESNYTDEFRMLRHDGEYRWLVSQAVPRYSVQGQFDGLAGSVLDVTERRMAERKLLEANANLAAELAESTRKELEILHLSSRLIDAQEEERKRLARELHDDLSQQIAALSIATGNLKRQIPLDFADARAQSDRIHQKLVHLAEGVRRMSHELHPAMLQYSGLSAALRSYCEEFSALTGIQVSVEIEGDFQGVPAGSALCLFRVAQEALRNVAKHAKVATAAVELRRVDAVLHLVVSDGGTGMDLAMQAAQTGLGILSIQERVRLCRGDVKIESGPGQGTRVYVRIPE